MKPLTDQECRQLVELAERAIEHGQFSLRVQSEDEDGNAASGDDWKPYVVFATHADQPERPEVCIEISDDSACFLAGTTPEAADAAWLARMT